MMGVIQSRSEVVKVYKCGIVRGMKLSCDEAGEGSVLTHCHPDREDPLIGNNDDVIFNYKTQSITSLIAILYSKEVCGNYDHMQIVRFHRCQQFHFTSQSS